MPSIYTEEELAAKAARRAELVAAYGDVWDTDELTQAFDVLSFMAPMVNVRRKSDGRAGYLYFVHNPRLYYGFQERS